MSPLSRSGPGTLPPHPPHCGLELTGLGARVGGGGSESTGLEFAHFRVIILMQIVLRFSKEGLVSLTLSN